MLPLLGFFKQLWVRLFLMLRDNGRIARQLLKAQGCAECSPVGRVSVA